MPETGPVMPSSGDRLSSRWRVLSSNPIICRPASAIFLHSPTKLMRRRIDRTFFLLIPLRGYTDDAYLATRRAVGARLSPQTAIAMRLSAAYSFCKGLRLLICHSIRPHFTVLEHPKSFTINTCRLKGVRKADWWFIHRFQCELKRAPVDTDGIFCS